MNDTHSTLSPCEEYARILSVLGKELSALDRAGAHKAAAHLDEAIHQLRRDQTALRKASAAHATKPTQTLTASEKASILACFSTSFSEAFEEPQVFTRKAKPANSR